MNSNRDFFDQKALTTDYREGAVSREEATLYPLVQRGSARLVRDLYRTEIEQREYIQRGMKLKLPGQKGYRDTSSGVLGLFQYIVDSIMSPRK